MVLTNFDSLKAYVLAGTQRKRVAVVAAEDEHTLAAVLQARAEGIIEPLLLGDAAQITACLKSLHADFPATAILSAENPLAAAAQAVALIHQQRADCLMKGKIQTADLMRAVIDRERGLRLGRIISHLAFIELPGYHKLLTVTDGGMALYPNVAEKKQILENALELLWKIGYACPKVAVLAAVETVNQKMPATIDGARLKQLNQTGEIPNCLIEGPISYDLAMCPESARIKGYASAITGDVDVMLVPDVTAGNLMAKALVYSAGGKMAGIILGAQVPIVLTSRGSTTEEKFLSLLLAASAA